MGIHYLEFYDMYDYFKKDNPIKLSEAVDRWKDLKDIGKDTMIGWKDLLDEVTSDLVDHGYFIGEAKRDTWNQYYEAIAKDSRRWQFHILELKDWFFNTYRRYPCKNCGYFTWDHRKSSGYCNNFCIDISSKSSRCVSEEG